MIEEKFIVGAHPIKTNQRTNEKRANKERIGKYCSYGEVERKEIK